MPIAVGTIETQGFPAILAAADAAIKAARVTLVSYDIAESGRHFIALRGAVAEIQTAIAAGVEAGNHSNGGQVLTYMIVPSPPENVVEVLPIHYTDQVQDFR
ncbi:MAG: BMC domain-containing protein [Pseudanabaenaceae cyanobacterium bins.68]|nr:BMC domain-containing protein [Pseudanabaenaceae cyanobacterium bins.68]